MTSANLTVVELEPAGLQVLSEQPCAQMAESVRARGVAVVELPAEGGSPAVAAWRGAGESAPLQFDAERGDLARVSLDKPLIAQQGVGEIADVTSTAETAGHIALAAFSILSAASGHGRAVINNSRKQELRADPDQFDAVAEEAQATVALEALAARLAAPSGQWRG